MSGTRTFLPDPDRRTAPALAFFRTRWLAAYGTVIALFYAALMLMGYRHGWWLVTDHGTPFFFDFILPWLAGHAALHGHAALLYDPHAFVRLQQAVVGPRASYYPHWPFPPTYLLLLAPLATLGFAAAFLAFETATLLACAAVVFAIVRRWAAIPVFLALPFAAWNFLAGQDGFLTAALLGGALLALEDRPVTAGLCLALLTYKPQFGILFPVALCAAREWRAIGAALVAAALLAAVSAAAFGTAAWAAFPHELARLGTDALSADAEGQRGLFHTVYGMVRDLGGPPLAAGLAQGAFSAGAAAIVWFVWRAPLRHALKAAILAAATLVATPYALAYDLAVLAIPVAFLARDQLDHGFLRGEQTSLLALFAASFLVLPTAGRMPLDIVIAFLVLCLALRRAPAVPAAARASRQDHLRSSSEGRGHRAATAVTLAEESTAGAGAPFTASGDLRSSVEFDKIFRDGGGLPRLNHRPPTGRAASSPFFSLS